MGSPAIDRRDALQRAVTLSVYRSEDFGQSQSILKNARWFLDLAHSDAVAEALATRRQAREAALSKATEAANKAADATGNAFDRVALQIAAAAGIIFAQYKALLTRWRPLDCLVQSWGFSLLARSRRCRLTSDTSPRALVPSRRT